MTLVMVTLIAYQPELPWTVLRIGAGTGARTSRVKEMETCRKLNFSHHLEEKKGIKIKQQAE